MTKKRTKKAGPKTPVQLRTRIKDLEERVISLTEHLNQASLREVEFNQERTRMKYYADACERRLIALRALVNDNPPR